ncbi:hypothetical protein HNQ07_004233 [Deinococcus metalli]|uniref:site-specific DNA-methyltransferase (adenine-specific) n=1 Tax=Deinococcus metalli TaxID=1141878 RepID=A0A7W8NR97_9DEIO|nr:DNA methyltransferase [Deinococcus metalli]MBB5378726.1 hypothetical protein [Deinococcus metalli]GHF60395.1 hypothetical protein GCM10017781_40720 [Deinococcus metalli]
MTDQAPTPQALRKALQAPDPRPLFEELGWDNPNSGPISEEADGQPFTFTPVARKVNFVVYRASPAEGGKIPGRDVIRKLERKLDAKAAERLVIYSTASGEQALWVRHKKEQGKAASLYTVEYKRGLRNEALVHYLKSLYVSLDEDLDGLTTIDVARKASNIEIEKVTKKFYKEFDRVRKAFVTQIDGVAGDDREHYAGLTLNRLMFVYFIQKKEYLDGDTSYLQNRLKRVQAQRGSGQFQSFYRAFLLRLFHEGLGALPHDAGLTALIGKVPYLNGGLFEEHRIEQENTTIEIPDQAFEKVFAFFDGWRWTIDESARAEADEAGKPEINPDVLGYIFEQYINNKQMGAYYTKEDITEYISKNTILPFVLERTRENCRVAFEGEHTVWDLLRENPDRYIHAAVRKGSEYELPDHIKAGLDPDQPDLLEKRKAWNRKADEEYALPTEIWREVVARHTRYAEVRGKLERGEVHSVSDLITLNLDIITFAQDVIRYAEGPELIRALWKAITTVTVLDPTCGSGAFLFAAAGILAPLYHQCLDSMTSQVVALPEGDKRLPDFREVLAEQAQHDRQYYVLKQIIIRNLYGVDIMAEAVEIAKLRLFLKLMAFSQKDDRKPNLGLEPLPDIDFNIRAGNTLVGYATRDEAEKAVTGRLLGTSGITWEQIEEKAGDIDRLEQMFREQQLSHGGQVTPEDKRELRRRLGELETLLNGYLAADYGIDEKKKPGSFEAWRENHQPFHWFIEFHNVMSRGGFDSVIGNPPYVEYAQVRRQYTIDNYKTGESGNLYAFTFERCIKITRDGGLVGLVVPHSIAATYRMEELQKLVLSKNMVHFSFFSRRPGKLFNGADQCVSIVIMENSIGDKKISTTDYYRWYTEARDYIFENLAYETVDIEEIYKKYKAVPKLQNSDARTVLEKISSHAPMSLTMSGDNGNFYAHRIARYFIKSTCYIPFFRNEKDGIKRSDDYKQYKADSSKSARIMSAIVNSSLFYLYWRMMYDGYHCGKENIESFPISIRNLSDYQRDLLFEASEEIDASYQRNSKRKKVVYKSTGEVEYDEFEAKKSKESFDKVDFILANVYNFSTGELDYIINYDIKYRLGADAEGED